jgi:hypothetical protein
MAWQDAGGALFSMSTGNLSRLSSRLPFTKDYTVVPVLFLKNEPTDNSANVMLPQDVIGLLK